MPHKPGESWNVVCQLIELEEAYPDKFKQRVISPGHEVFQVFADVMELEMGTGRRTGARLRRWASAFPIGAGRWGLGFEFNGEGFQDLRLASTARQVKNVSGEMHLE